MQSSKNAYRFYLVAKIGVGIDENMPRKDIEKWTIESSQLVIRMRRPCLRVSCHRTRQHARPQRSPRRGRFAALRKCVWTWRQQVPTSCCFSDQTSNRSMHQFNLKIAFKFQMPNVQTAKRLVQTKKHLEIERCVLYFDHHCGVPCVLFPLFSRY